MTKKFEKRGLGRGLSALMADINVNPGADPQQSPGEAKVAIEKILPNPDQPRRNFQQEDLADLSASIAEKGVIQPLIVRPDSREPGNYQIVAGERRWRAAQMANLHELPVLIRDFSDAEVLEVAIIENIQRADLNPVEEATGFRQLMDRFGHTQEKLSAVMGKSRSHIANLLRLLKLPPDVLAQLRDGRLSAGHARALVTAVNPSKLAREVISKGLSVRQTEKLVKHSAEPVAKRSLRPVSGKDADTLSLEADLAANLNMKVEINHSKLGESGKMLISYKDLDQLDVLCGLLTPTTQVESK